MNKFIKALAAVVLAIGVAYFFLIDNLIKTQLEREGSRALQTPLAIDKATFHLLPTSLTLRGVSIGNPRVPTHDIAQADAVAVPFALRDLLAHKFIVDTIDVHGLRFNRPRAPQSAVASIETPSATQSPQLHEALQRVQQMINNPLASNTIDPNASITGALLADQFKPLLAQITAALSAVSAPSDNVGDWQILARRVNVDGALNFGSNEMHFIGGIDNVTPQPALFDVVTQFELRSADGEAAKLHASGRLDKRKSSGGRNVTQANLRFDLSDFALSQWPLSNDAELKIDVLGATANVQAMVALIGNQFDFNALMHFRDARLDIAAGDSAIARIVADVLRQTNMFDMNLQASGEIANPALKLNSSLDVPLANAIRQAQANAPVPANVFPGSAQPFSP